MPYRQWTQQETAQAFAVGRGVEVVRKQSGQPVPAHGHLVPVLLLDDDEMLLGWPSDKSPTPHLGAMVEVSILRQEPEGNKRYGYLTSVIDILDGPEWKGGMVGLMVMPPRARDLEPVELHNGDRYHLTDSRALSFFVPGLGSVVPLDLSLHSLSFRYPQNGRTLKMGQAVALDLLIHDTSYQVSGKVVHLAQNDEWQEVSVKLHTLPLDVRAALVDTQCRLETNFPLAGPRSNRS
jgi:hypothetical protein